MVAAVTRKAYERRIPECMDRRGLDPMAQGWSARREGYEFEDNPRVLRDALLWAMGWLEADEDMMGRLASGERRPEHVRVWDAGKAAAWAEGHKALEAAEAE